MSNSPPPVKKIRRHSSKEPRKFYDPSSLEVKIEEFQKEAIYRQLLEYKRDVSRLEAQGKDNLARREAREEQVGVVLSELQLIYDQLESLFEELGVSEGINRFDSLELLGQILDNQIEINDFKRKLGSQRNSTVNLFCHIKNLLKNLHKNSRDLNNKINNSKDNQDKTASIKLFLESQIKLLNGIGDLSSSSKELNEVDKLKEQVRFLQSEKKSDKQEILSKDEKIEEMTDKLKSLEKSVDRLRMELSKKPKDAETSEKETEKPEVVSLLNDKVLEDLKEKYGKEIKQLREEKAELSSQLDVARTKSHDVPEEAIRASYVYKDAVIQANHFEHELENQFKRNNALKAEIDLLLQEKSESLERYLHEEKIRQETIEKELKKVVADVSKFKSHRDHLLAELNRVQNRENIDLKEKSELRTLVTSHGLLIQQLKSENQRFRKVLSYYKKDKEAIEYIERNPEVLNIIDPYSTIIELQNENKDLKEKFNALMKTLNDSHDTDEFFKQNKGLVDKVFNLNKENSRLTEKLSLIEGKEKEALAAEVLELKEKVEESIRLQATLEEGEAKAQKEVDLLKNSIYELNTSHLSKMTLLRNKEDQIIFANEEKAKLEVRFTRISKDNENFNYLTSTLKNQTEKLKEYIRKLEDQSKALTFQLKTMEREININSEARDHMEERLKSLSRLNHEFKDQRMNILEKISELESVVHKKTHLLEEEINSKNRLNDEVTVLKGKLKALSSRTSKDESEDLKETLKQYRSLMTCPTCDMRFKSHVLVRCMHVFCKQCIDSRLETRQRKCPTCNESFGANDVKTIYL